MAQIIFISILLPVNCYFIEEVFLRSQKLHKGAQNLYLKKILRIFARFFKRIMQQLINTIN